MKDNEVALWSGVFAFFGSLIAIGIFDVFNPDQWVEYIGAIDCCLYYGRISLCKRTIGDEIAKEQG